MSENNLLRCPVCWSDMIRQDNEPRILPACGHTICIICLENILSSSKECPLCRTKYTNYTDSSAFPKNFFLGPLIEDCKSRLCDSHGNSLDLVCIDCKMLLCNKCFLNSEHQKHKVETVEDFYSVVGKRSLEISSLIDQYKKVKQKDEEYLGILQRETTKFVEREFDQRIEKLKKKKEETLKIIEDSFSHVKDEMLKDVTELQKLQKQNLSIEQRKNNIGYAMEVYLANMEEKRKKIEGLIGENGLEDIIKEVSKLQIKFDDKFEDLISGIVDVKVLETPVKRNCLEAISNLGAAIADNNPHESAKLFMKSIDYIEEDDEGQQIINLYKKIADLYLKAEDTLAIYRVYQNLTQIKAHSEGEKAFKEYLEKQIAVTHEKENKILKMLSSEEENTNPQRLGLRGLKKNSKILDLNSLIQCFSNLYLFTCGFFKNSGQIEKAQDKAPLSTAYLKILRNLWLERSNTYTISAEHFENSLCELLAQKGVTDYTDTDKVLDITLSEMMSEASTFCMSSRKGYEETKSMDHDDLSISEAIQTEVIRKITCTKCHKTHTENYLLNFLTLNSHSADYQNDFFFLISKDYSNGVSKRIDFNLPKDSNYYEVLNKISKLTNIPRNHLLATLELKDHSLQIITEDKDVSTIRNTECHSGFLYEIPGLEEVQKGNAFLVRLYVFDDKAIDNRVGRPHFLLVKNTDSFRDLFIKIYQKVRIYVHEYYSKMNIQHDIVIEDHSHIEEEYERLSLGQHPAQLFYNLYLKKGIRPRDPDLEMLDKSLESTNILSYLKEKSVPLDSVAIQLSLHPTIQTNKISFIQSERAFDLEEEYCLNHCLDLFTRPQREGSQSVQCPNCKEDTEVIIKREMKKLPETLIIYFNNQQPGRIKTINIPHKLNLEEYVPNNLKDQASYALNGVCCRRNSTSTAYAKNLLDKKWYKFNDLEVAESPVHASDVRNESVYLIFYNRV